MALAAEGRLLKDALAPMLTFEARRRFLQACAAIEMHYTDACAAADDPCLEPGCALAGENHEICLQPVLRSEAEYLQACGAEWVRLFETPANRMDSWMQTASTLVAGGAATARR
jgi:hypothetical protein